MKQIITKLLCVGGILLANISYGQSLQSFIEQALEQNYQIQIIRNDAEVAENNNTLGNSGMLPTVNLNGQYTNSFNNTKQQLADNSVREGTNAQNTNLSLSALANWTVFKGFSVYAKRNQLAYLEQIGQLNSAFYIEQTISDIVNAYYQLVYERQVYNTLKANLTVSSYRNTLALKKKELGAGTIMDYGQALVDYQTDSMQVLAQENRIKSLEIALNLIVNEGDLEKTIQVSDNGFDLQTIASKATLLENLENSNSQLDMQNLQELVAETQLRIDRVQRYPTVNLFAGYQYSKSTAAVGFISSNLNYGPTVGVSVSFNLFNGGATNRTIKNSAIYAETATLSKNQLDQKLQAEVLSLYAQYHNLSKRVELAKSNVKNVEKVYVAAEQQLKTGTINGYDFRLTQQSVLSNELTLVALAYNLKAIEVNLKRLTGETLISYVK